MTTPAVLAKLNPKTVRFDVGSGGVPEFEQCDIAASLAGDPPLPELAVKLALVKYAGQQQELGKLFYWTRNAAVTLAVKHGWKPRKGQLGGISVYAIWEHVDPHYCPVCQGSGQRMNEYRHSVRCVACAGSKFALIPDEYRAEIAGIDPVEWLNVWLRRATLLSDHLAKMDRWAVGRIKSRLSDER